MELNRVFLIIFGLLFCIRVFGQSVTDQQFFESINLDLDGLQPVKSCILSNDYVNAKKEYIKYLKQRESPVWYFDWDAPDTQKRNTIADLKEADRYANNELVSCGIWHQFGQIVDWRYDPTNNDYPEWTWQLNRHYDWIVLGSAYWNTGDEKYSKAFVSQLNSWLDQCKCPNDNGYYPRSAWRTLEAGLRMRYSWPYAFFYFLSSPYFDDESVFRMVKSIYEHALFLNKHSTSSQRLSHEMNGLYTVGALFPEFHNADDWRRLSAEKLYEEEVNQFYPDGSQKELAPSYHGTNLSCIVSVYRLAKLNHYQLPNDYVTRLENIYSFYEKLMMPDGRLPSVNDSRWMLGKDNLIEAADIFQDRPDFTYLATRGENGKKPSFTSVWMPWAGWYVMRSGWGYDDFYALFEVGPYGSGHQHEDKLSVILYAYGSRLITECGNYAYDNSQWRDYAVSARAHNVARVDGKDQNRFAVLKEDGVSVNSTACDYKWVTKRKYDEGEGYYKEGFGEDSDKSVTHHRILRFVKNKFWLLTDEFIPSDRDLHSYDIWFHFNTEHYKIDTLCNVIYSTEPSSANVAVIRLGNCHDNRVIVGSQSPEVQGWVSDGSSSEGFNCRPVATPIFHNEGVGVVRERFVFIPIPKGKDLRIESIKQLSSRKYRVYMNDGSKYSIRL